MEKRANRNIVICDTDLDHSFTLEGELKNQNYDVVNITDASELVGVAQSLRPSAILVNPDMKGFNENEVCRKIKGNLNVPVLLLLDRNSTHRAQIGDCQADDVLTKPTEIGNLLTLLRKHIAINQL